MTRSRLHSRLHFSAALASALLAGCASSVKLDEGAPVEARSVTDANAAAAAAGAGANAAAPPQSQIASVDLTKRAVGSDAAGATAAAAGLARVLYFDYDSYAVKDEYRPAIDGHARVLAAERKRRMTAEGHTDARGGSEYNLALGQKRADAVAKSLTLLGAGDAQVEAVSFGKERPAAPGNDEAAYAKNRRVELNYR